MVIHMEMRIIYIILRTDGILGSTKCIEKTPLFKGLLHALSLSALGQFGGANSFAC